MILTGQNRGCDFEVELDAGPAVSEVVGHLTELVYTTRLCQALGISAIISDGGMSGLTWMLVTSDGWHDRAGVDEEALDEGQLKITHAYQPGPSAPETPVEHPPEWQAGWCEDGQVPGSGYLAAEG